MTDAQASLRLFIAVELSEAWLNALGSAQDRLSQRLGKRGLPRLRWVRPEGSHITLKFLGQVALEKREEIEEGLARIPGQLLGFQLALGRPGSFGDRRGPRVVWVGIEGATERLSRLVAAVEAEIAPLGFATEKRPFAPHLTLARVPDDYPSAVRLEVGREIAGLEVPPAAQMVVSEVSLMQSHLGRGGARYERLSAFPKLA